MAEVSVIIATCNVEAYIERAIRSALDQEDVTVEIIVVDDCSSDGTWGKVLGMNDPRLKSRRRARNGGPGAARNAAIELATGNWIAVLDGDDAFLPGRLRRCLDRAAVVGADIVVDNLEARRELDGKTFPLFAPAYLARFETLTLAAFLCGNACFSGGHTLGYLKPLFSRQFLLAHALDYNPDLRIGEDYLLLASALASGAVCAVEQSAGYAYTIRAGSISHRLALADIDRMLAADADFLDSYELDQATLKAQRHRTARLQAMRAYIQLVSALKTRNFTEAWRLGFRHPLAVLGLWRPLRARLRRLITA
jgi:succinoglycan biosynthesis protein ExoO